MEKAAVGKIILIAIAVINIVSTIFTNLILNFNLLALVVQIALSFALMSGVNWVRYLFAVGAGLAAFITLIYITTPGVVLPVWMIAYFVLNTIYSIVVCVVLFVSKSVSEYIYERKHG
jgi:hypothetical protein